MVDKHFVSNLTLKENVDRLLKQIPLIMRTI